MQVTRRPAPSLTGGLTTNATAEVVRALPHARYGSAIIYDLNGPTFVSSVDANVAGGIALLVGTVTALKRPIIWVFEFSGSIAGLYIVRYNNIALGNYRIVANQFVQMNISQLFGMFRTPQGANIDILNNSGAASQITANAQWSEVD